MRRGELQFLEVLAFKIIESTEILLPRSPLKEAEDKAEYSLDLDDNPQLLNIEILKSYDDRPTGNQAPTEVQHSVSTRFRYGSNALSFYASRTSDRSYM